MSGNTCAAFFLIVFVRFQCKQSGWLAAVLVLTIGIKLFQNWLYTKIGQLQRALDFDKDERNWNNPGLESFMVEVRCLLV